LNRTASAVRTEHAVAVHNNERTVLSNFDSNKKLSHRVRRDPFCRRQNIALCGVSARRIANNPYPEAVA